MKALVTGAYGFIGRHVARRLAEDGYSVTGLGHGAWSRQEWSKWGIQTWHSADAMPDTLASYGDDPEVIVHCAGSGSVAYSMFHPRQDFERTVGTALAVFEFQRIYAPKARLVIPSSAAVYGSVATMPITVTTPRNPVSPYGTNKKIVEDLARSYARHFGSNTALVRLFSIYGIGLRKQLFWDACEKFAKGDVDFSGTGEETRDWLHVDDAARLIIAAAAASGPDCPVFNGGTGVATANRAVLELLSQQRTPPLEARFLGGGRPGDPLHYQADMSSTCNLQWRPLRDLSVEVKAYAEWYAQGAQ